MTDVLYCVDCTYRHQRNIQISSVGNILLYGAGETKVVVFWGDEVSSSDMGRKGLPTRPALAPSCSLGAALEWPGTVWAGLLAIVRNSGRRRAYFWCQ